MCCAKSSLLTLVWARCLKDDWFAFSQSRSAKNSSWLTWSGLRVASYTFLIGFIASSSPFWAFLGEASPSACKVSKRRLSSLSVVADWSCDCTS